MNFVPCLTWVAKGIAKSTPDKLQLSPDELKSLIEETKDLSGKLANDDDSSEAEISEDENEKDNQEPEDNDAAEEEEQEEEDFDARYDLQSYDDDGEDRPFMNISDVATFVDNKEDNYITDYDAVAEDEKEDEEDFIIKESDNLLLVGHIEEESSVLEVYVCNSEEEALYVHHDIVLPAYPLALEWLDFHPSEESAGNYVAVGDMTSIIKVWDLDVVDILEPDYCLGKELKEKKMEKIKLKYHTDAVLSLSWNKHVRNILASGSADSSIVIWDLQVGKPLNKLEYHTNKVQSLQWHPFESSFLLSGCTDGIVKLYDCRAPDTECKSWKIDGEIEKVAWNLFEPIKFLCSTDKGFVHSVDMKSDKIEHSIKAHTDAVTGLDMCPTSPNILVTASMDKTIKIWDLQKLSYLQTHKLKVGSIYTAKFAPDSKLTLAIGGNNRSNSLKVMDLEEKLNASEESSSKESTSNLNSKTERKIGNTSELQTKKKKAWNQNASMKPSGKKFKNFNKSMKSESNKMKQNFSGNLSKRSAFNPSCTKTEQNASENSKKKSRHKKNKMTPDFPDTSFQSNGSGTNQLDCDTPPGKRIKKET